MFTHCFCRVVGLSFSWINLRVYFKHPGNVGSPRGHRHLHPPSGHPSALDLAYPGPASGADSESISDQGAGLWRGPRRARLGLGLHSQKASSFEKNFLSRDVHDSVMWRLQTRDERWGCLGPMCAQSRPAGGRGPDAGRCRTERSTWEHRLRLGRPASSSFVLRGWMRQS